MTEGFRRVRLIYPCTLADYNLKAGGVWAGCFTWVGFGGWFGHLWGGAWPWGEHGWVRSRPAPRVNRAKL